MRRESRSRTQWNSFCSSKWQANNRNLRCTANLEFNQWPRKKNQTFSEPILSTLPVFNGSRSIQKSLMWTETVMSMVWTGTLNRNVPPETGQTRYKIPTAIHSNATSKTEAKTGEPIYLSHLKNYHKQNSHYKTISTHLAKHPRYHLSQPRRRSKIDPERFISQLQQSKQIYS